MKSTQTTGRMEKERQQMLDRTLSEIEKDYGKGAVMKLGDRPHMQADVFSTGSISTDIALGIGLGGAGAIGVSRLLQSMVFDVSTTDPVTFGAMALLLAITGLVACWLPARWASGIDPVETMRSE